MQYEALGNDPGFILRLVTSGHCLAWALSQRWSYKVPELDQKVRVDVAETK
jgi:hypothetical protein